MGDTGRAHGSHLDWRMEIRGVRVDPYLLVKKQLISFFLYKLLLHLLCIQSHCSGFSFIQELK